MSAELFQQEDNDLREHPLYLNFPHVSKMNEVIETCLKIVSMWPYEKILDQFVKHLNMEFFIISITLIVIYINMFFFCTTTNVS